MIATCFSPCPVYATDPNKCKTTVHWSALMHEEGFGAVEKFILEEIDTVPHLEALLLLWNNRSRQWTLPAMAKAIYISTDETKLVLSDLERRGFAVATGEDCFQYRSSDRDTVLEQVDAVYRQHIVRISTLIHSKPAASLREFARAFRLKKDRS